MKEPSVKYNNKIFFTTILIIIYLTYLQSVHVLSILLSGLKRQNSVLQELLQPVEKIKLIKLIINATLKGHSWESLNNLVFYISVEIFTWLWLTDSSEVSSEGHSNENKASFSKVGK